MSKGSLCFATGATKGRDGALISTIELRQQGRDRFSVRYGLQLKTGLSYGQAARELGMCIMHMQACEGLLDNAE